MSFEPSDSETAGRLLAYLRTTLRTPGLAYAEQPSRLTGGFDTLIYSFRLSGASAEMSGPLILRVFREDNPWVTLSAPERARFETAVQNNVAALGYPVARVLHTCEDAQPLGSSF